MIRKLRRFKRRKYTRSPTKLYLLIQISLICMVTNTFCFAAEKGQRMDKQLLAAILYILSRFSFLLFGYALLSVILAYKTEEPDFKKYSFKSFVVGVLFLAAGPLARQIGLIA